MTAMTNAPPLPDIPAHKADCAIYMNGGQCGCGYYQRVNDYAPTLRSVATTLRAQLSEARVENERLKETNLGCAPNCERGDYLRSRLSAETARADANAKLMKQELARIENKYCSCRPMHGYTCGLHEDIRNIDAALSGAPT